MLQNLLPLLSNLKTNTVHVISKWKKFGHSLPLGRSESRCNNTGTARDGTQAAQVPEKSCVP